MRREVEAGGQKSTKEGERRESTWYEISMVGLEPKRG